MKRFAALLLLCAVLALAATGCKPSTPTSAAQSAPASQAVSEAGAPAPASSQPSSNPSSSASSSTPELHSISGVIDDMGMGKYYVETDDGRTIAFEYGSADLSKLTDDRPGSKIVVYYTGTLSGTDTGGITVKRMETP